MARLLRNPLYAGYTQLDGELHEGEHEAIVDRETFEEARAIREGRTGSVADRGRNPDFVLRGLLRCVAARPDGTPCSHPMLPASTRKGGREYRYYRCSARDGEPGTRCTGRPLPAQPIERLVVERIARALATSRELVPTLCERLGRASRELRATLSEELRAPVAVADVEAAERRRAFLERRLASLPEGDVDAGWVAGAIQSFHRIWDALRPEDRRRLLRALVAYVEADPRSHAVTVALAHPDPLAPVRGEAQESFARDREIIRTGLDLGVNYA